MSEFSKTVAECVDALLMEVRSDTGQNARIFPNALSELNQAIAIVVSLNRWNWNRKEGTLNIAQGNRLIQLPDDCLALEKMNIAVDGVVRVLTEISQDEAKVTFADPTDQGSPAAYCQGAYNFTDTTNAPKKVVQILPTSDGAYTANIIYSATIKEYDTGNYTEALPVPPFMLPAILELAKAKLLSFVKAPAIEVQRAEINAEKLLVRAKQADVGYNRKTQAIRLPVEISNYRASRYKS